MYLVIETPFSLMFRICSDACSEEQKAEGKGTVHTVSLLCKDTLKRGELSSSLAQATEKLCGRYVVASGFGLLHGETSTEWAALTIQIFILVLHANLAP